MSFLRAICKTLPTLAGLDALKFDELGTTGNVFAETIPAGPDLAVGVFSDGGGGQPLTNPTNLPAFRVQVRGNAGDVFGAADIAQAIIDGLNCLDHTTLDVDGDDETVLIGCTATQSTPVPLGRDANERPEFVTYFDARVHHPTANRPATTGV